MMYFTYSSIASNMLIFINIEDNHVYKNIVIFYLSLSIIASHIVIYIDSTITRH